MTTESGQRFLLFHLKNVNSIPTISFPHRTFSSFYPLSFLLWASCRVIIIALKSRRMRALTDASIQRLRSIFFTSAIHISTMPLSCCELAPLFVIAQNRYRLKINEVENLKSPMAEWSRWKSEVHWNVSSVHKNRVHQRVNKQT